MGRDTSIITLNLRHSADSVACSEAKWGINVGVCSDVGRVRGNNEDSYIAAPDLDLYLLSDGMGGMASGEIASRLTVDTIRAHWREASATPLALVGLRIQGVSEAANVLVSGIRLANRIVFNAGCDNPGKQKMGATVVAIQFLGERMSVAHVGDSRAYRLRGDDFVQLTRDHSFVAEMGNHRRGGYEAAFSSLQHLLTRAVGVDPEVEADVADELVMDGDIVLLCSDGLTRELSDGEIAAVLRDAGNAQKAADLLVALANEAGGRDNITAIVVRHALKNAATASSASRLRNWFSNRETDFK